MSVVSAQGLSLTYPGNIEALKNVDLSIEAGEFVSFIGPSGCGKTTLLRVVADLEQPTGGSVLVTGQTPEEARQARAYGYVFQQPGVAAVAHGRGQYLPATGAHGAETG